MKHATDISLPLPQNSQEFFSCGIQILHSIQLSTGSYKYIPLRKYITARCRDTVLKKITQRLDVTWLKAIRDILDDSSCELDDFLLPDLLNINSWYRL